MARLPIITLRRDIDVRVVFGQSIFELYKQIQNLLQREAPVLSNFFAEPIVNVVRGEISWHTRAVGNPRLASDLSPEEFNNIRQRLNNNCNLVKLLIEKLEKVGRGNSAGTEALRGMLMTPDLMRSLFVVGDELVLTQWGCYIFGTDARSADLFEQIERYPNLAPSPYIPRVLEPVDQYSTTSISNPDENTSPSAPAAPDVLAASEDSAVSHALTPTVTPSTLAEASHNFLWRWLWLLLLLFLLLLGILWKYWQGHGWNSEVALRADVAALWQKVDKKYRECGLITRSTESGGDVPVAPVTNAEFRERQNENSIKPDSRVNVSLAWNDWADLDLIVVQPDGHEVYFKPCASVTCGTLDVDANYCDPRFTCSNLKDKPLENISWRGQMPKGRYVVYVGLYSTNKTAAETRSIPYTVQITKDGKSTTYQGVVRREEMTCKDQCTSGLRRIAEFIIE